MAPPAPHPATNKGVPPRAGSSSRFRHGGGAATGQASVAVHYLERSSILVRGPTTGRQYAFSQARPVQRVDLRDAPSLLRIRFFRTA